MDGKTDIVVDIDEILCETLRALLEYHNKKYSTDYRWEKFHRYTFSDIDNCTKKESVAIFTEFFDSEYIKDMLPIEGSQKAIEYLSKKYRLHLVTGRPDKYKELTESFIDKYYDGRFLTIEYTSHYYKNNPVKKSDICKKLGAKIIIEDDPAHIIDCAGNGMTVIVLNRPWNKDTANKNIIRVDSWEEIVKAVDKLVKELY